MIVVGSTNSSNSVRLVEVAKDNGAKAGYLVDYAKELDPAGFEGATTVGLSSGASVRETVVQDVIRQLSEWGFAGVEEVTTATDDVLFSLPRERRRTLKADGDNTNRPQELQNRIV